jgi:hypothetical protein
VEGAAVGARPFRTALVSVRDIASPEALRERIAELEEIERSLLEEMSGLRRRLLAVVDVVPVSHLGLMTGRSARGSDAALHGGPRDLFTGWVESTELVPSEVAAELRLLWQRSPRAS